MDQSWMTQEGPVKEVKVNVVALKDKVVANRATHRAEFEKALVGYRLRLMAELEIRIEDLRAGRAVDQYIRIPVPEDHTGDYDQIITMLEMSEDPVVVIDYRTFRQYVMDEWDWKAGFTATNSTYNAVEV